VIFVLTVRFLTLLVSFESALMSDPHKIDQVSESELYFHKQNEKLLHAMRSELGQQKAIDDLAHASGITDQGLLKEFAAHRISALSVQAIGLIPLVAVAWSDRMISEAERTAILRGAEENGVNAGSPTHQALQSLLTNRPHAALFDAWKGYAQGLAKQLDSNALDNVREKVLAQVDRVARAAGGFLGIAAISQAEAKIIDEVKAALGG
jgi:hypothetical protein